MFQTLGIVLLALLGISGVAAIGLFTIALIRKLLIYVYNRFPTLKRFINWLFLE